MKLLHKYRADWRCTMRGRIEKRVGPRGVSYRIRVELGTDPVEGTRRQPSKTFATRKEAEGELTKWLNEVQNGTFIEPDNTKLADYLSQWLAGLGGTIRGSTERRYK